MSKTRTGRIVATIVCGLILSLVFGNMVARAAGGPNTLTVQATSNEELKEDLASAGVVVDVYQVAAAAKDTSYDTYIYTLFPAFGDYTLSENPKASDWEKLATESAKLANEGKLVMVAEGAPVDTAIGTGDGLADGLYLIMARGADQTAGSLRAQSAEYVYSFTPVIVSLPTKYSDDGTTTGTITTAQSSGAWRTNVVAQLKPEQTPRYGSLVIQKQVSNFDGEPATFVFHVVSVADSTHEEGELYNEYVSLYFTGGTEDYVLVNKLPAGIEVRVDEEYEGARYRLTSENGQTTTIGAAATTNEDGSVNTDGVASVGFTNERINDVGGHGIENHFVWTVDETRPQGDWAWTATPEDSANPAGQ